MSLFTFLTRCQMLRVAGPILRQTRTITTIVGLPHSCQSAEGRKTPAVHESTKPKILHQSSQYCRVWAGGVRIFMQAPKCLWPLLFLPLVLRWLQAATLHLACLTTGRARVRYGSLKRYLVHISFSCISTNGVRYTLALASPARLRFAVSCYTYSLDRHSSSERLWCRVPCVIRHPSSVMPLTLAARFHLSPSAAAIPLIITVARPMSTSSCGNALSCFKGEVLPKRNTRGRQNGKIWRAGSRRGIHRRIAVLGETGDGRRRKKVQYCSQASVRYDAFRWKTSGVTRQTVGQKQQARAGKESAHTAHTETGQR